MIHQLTFENATDLQTRIRLVPRIDEEGIGAVVDAYVETARVADEQSNNGVDHHHSGPDDDADETIPTMTGLALLRLEGGNTERKSLDCYEMEFSDILAAIRASACPIVLTVGNLSPPTNSSMSPPSSQQDYSVVTQHRVSATGILDELGEEKKSDEDEESASLSIEFEQELSASVSNVVLNKDFVVLSSSTVVAPAAQAEDMNDDILIRQDESNSITIDSETVAVTSSTLAQSATNLPLATPKNLLQDFSALWTTRVRATSAQLAADAASLTSVVASAAKERAIEAGLVVSNRNRTEPTVESNEASHNTSPDEVESPKELDLFLQTSSGGLIPVRIPPAPRSGSCSPLSMITNNSGERFITNNSLLLIRRSSTEPCPSDGYLFQWYRSAAPPPPLLSVSTATTGIRDDIQQNEWELLDGATSAAFQPSATEVGVRLRCIIRRPIDPTGERDGQIFQEDECIICETDDVVRASPPIFNGARQALKGGAQFSGLIGKGNAEGRSFRITVDMTFLPDTRRPANAVTIYQTSGSTSEPIHPQPLVGVHVASSYSNPKDLDLLLPTLGSFQAGTAFSGKVPSLLSELATDGRFKVQMPNRMARESLLIAIGIANYQGRPADLDVTTILHPSFPRYNSTAKQQETHRPSAEEEVNRRDARSIGKAQNPELVPPVKQSQAKSLPTKIETVADMSVICQDSKLVQPEGETPAIVRVAQLEQELEMLREKFSRKGRVISELQRCVADAESRLSKAEQLAASRDDRIRQFETMKQDYEHSLVKTEQEMANRDQTAIDRQRVHQSEQALLHHQLKVQADKIVEFEKSVRSLQNEKAVLSAAVDARDNKLSKMASLQLSFDQLSSQIEGYDALRKDLDEAENRHKLIYKELEKAKESDLQSKVSLEECRQSLAEKDRRLLAETKKVDSLKIELETQQVNIQKLKAERNSYKQKGDSLAKEMSRICQEGRTIREVEKMIADDLARRQEVHSLREQKRKALDELQHYRAAYEQTRAAQKLAGIDVDTMKVLERNAELERVVSELTEYVNAKEMQLETLRQVNETLQGEIRDLAKASMSRNDV